MPVSIVVGGQFGSEGKGKVTHYLAQKMEASYAVRCGGPNSGHTVIDPTGNARIFQQLSTAAILPDVKLAICAGSYIDLDILLREIKETGVDQTRLVIDPDAVIITKEMKRWEVQSGIMQRIGSTGSGTGAAVKARLNREEKLLFARDIRALSIFIQDVPKILRDSLDRDEHVIIEGTQGFGLSPLHSRLYPFTTSRDTTAAAFLSEVGLSPFDVKDIILTIRAFPIRVSGNSGPLDKETSWKEISEKGMFSEVFEEITSVSKKTRRVAYFSSDIVMRAICINRPTCVVLNHLDYFSAHHDEVYRKRITNFINEVEMSINQKVNYIGVGPDSMLENSLTSFEK